MLKQVCRSLWGRRASTIARITVLASVVGLASAVWSFADALLVAGPVSVAEPARTFYLSTINNFPAFRAAEASLSTMDIAAFTRNNVDIGMGASAESVAAECVTPAYFSVFGVSTPFGRAFQRTDGPADRAAVLYPDFAIHRFGSAAAAIGRQLLVDGHTYDVLGVVPPGFAGTGLSAPSLWIPLASAPASCSFSGKDLMSSDRASWLRVIGRLRPGAAAADTVAQLGGERGRREPLLTSMLERRQRSQPAEVARWLLLASAVLLLVGCLNTSSFLAVDLLRRSRDAAIRRVLGASTQRLMLEGVIEAGVIVACAAPLAMLAAKSMSAVMADVFPPGLLDGALQMRTVSSVLVLLTVAGGASVVLPTTHAIRRRPHALLGTPMAAPARLRVLRAILAAQIALAVAFLASTTMFAATIKKLSTGLGYDTSNVVLVSADLSKRGWPAERISQTFADIAEALKRVPGIEYVGTTSSPILESSSSGVILGVKRSGTSRPQSALFSAIDGDYFDAIGTRLMRGSAFPRDTTPVLLPW